MDLSTLLEKPDARLVRSASRKAACRLVPLLGAAVLVAWLDRATLANTASALEEAIALTVVQYGLAAGVFYISYLAMQVNGPALHGLPFLPPSYLLSGTPYCYLLFSAPSSPRACPPAQAQSASQFLLCVVLILPVQLRS